MGSGNSDTERAELLAALRLSRVPGIGPRLARRLIERCGSAEAVCRHPADWLAEIPGIGARLAAELSRSDYLQVAEQAWQDCLRAGIEVTCLTSQSYPRMLREIFDPPTVLYRRGTLAARDTIAIAIVGTRHASPYGLRVASRLAESLAGAGFTIVSGLARGIDAAAHRAALRVGGRSMAVLAGGLNQMYPPEHAQLADDLARSGGVLSEMPLDTQPRRGSFPRRNRLISGLSLGVIVVEATRRSGALITARHALEQGREVFAVPGPIDVRSSRGCHQLLRDGARLIETVDDVFDELGPLPLQTRDETPVRHPGELQLNSLERQVLQAIDDQETSVDQLTQRSGIQVHRILSTLSVLETRHLIQRVSGDRVRRR